VYNIILATGFGLVHEIVGGFYGGIDTQGRFQERGDTHAETHLGAVAGFDSHQTILRCRDAGPRPFVIRFRQEQCKLVTSAPADQIRASHALLQGGGYGGEHPIPGDMPAYIVHALEVIDVDINQGCVMPAAECEIKKTWPLRRKRAGS